MTVQSILNGDTTPKGKRAAAFCALMAALGGERKSGPRARVIEAEQDIVQIHFGDNCDAYFRCQVLFNNPKETKRIARPLSPRVETLANLLMIEGIRVWASTTLVDVLEIEYSDELYLLDCYLHVTPDKVI